MEKIIEVIKLYKTYMVGTVSVDILQDIDITVNKGEFITIMGASGSGKSTLLYLVGGLDKPTSGKIFIKGQDISNLSDENQSIMRRREIGFVFQFYNLVPNLTVEDNIMLPILLDGKKIKNYRDKLDEILEVVGLTNRKTYTPRELSGGQQQRVAIARALINEPDIILADEPTGNLDSKTSEEVMELFQRINVEKGKTILQVSHSQETTKYSNRIINVKDGRLW